jgi:hypothetical protein
VSFDENRQSMVTAATGALLLSDNNVQSRLPCLYAHSLLVIGPISALSYTLPVILSFTTQLGSCKDKARGRIRTNERNNDPAESARLKQKKIDVRSSWISLSGLLVSLATTAYQNSHKGKKDGH